MIINDSDAQKRLNSPLNLINRLRKPEGLMSDKRKSAMNLFIPPRSAEPEIAKSTETTKEVIVSFNPFDKPSSPNPTEGESVSPVLDDILANHESQIQLGLAHDKSIVLLNRAVDLLAEKLDDIKADKLPSVIATASKTVESIRRERNEAAKNNKDKEVHFHFYTPEQKKISDYPVIDVT